ncbi:11665_t:CDS:2, partial [Racocetra fulgida]
FELDKIAVCTFVMKDSDVGGEVNKEKDKNRSFDNIGGEVGINRSSSILGV